MSCAWFLPTMMSDSHTKEFILCLIKQEQRLSFIVWMSFRCLSANSRQAATCPFVRSGFHLANLLNRPNWWTAAEMFWWKVILFPQSFHWVLGQLPDKKSFSFLFLPILEDGGHTAHLLIGIFKAATFFFPVHFQYLCLDIILSGKSTDRSFYFVLGLCTGMHCLLWDLIKVIDVRVFKIVSNQLNLCLSSILSLMAKAVNIKSHRISF